mmetsp:Transcript_9189/g.18698  ORF Transcript_9189/g.18698 Transcript_9189/m.18698 type:complete len:200 (-) Transcript_9189:384-983(-)
MVRSPVLMTTPVAVPSTARVPKNARFLVSKGFSSVHCVPSPMGSDSPVKEELSTLSLETSTIRISAGILSPALTSTISPTTKVSAGTSIVLPSLRARVTGGRKFLNFSIVFSLLNSCAKVKRAVAATTTNSTKPRNKFSLDPSSPYPIKHRIPPTWRRMAKKFPNCASSFQYHGVTFGGLNTLGPSRSSLAWWSFPDKP